MSTYDRVFSHIHIKQNVLALAKILREIEKLLKENK